MPAAKINRRVSVWPRAKGQRARGQRGTWLGSRITIRLCKYFCCTLLLLLFVFVAALLLSPFLSLPLAWHGKFLSPFARCAFPFLSFSYSFFFVFFWCSLTVEKSRPGKSRSRTRTAALLFLGVRKRQKDIIKRGCQRYRRQCWTKASAKCTRHKAAAAAGQQSKANRTKSRAVSAAAAAGAIRKALWQIKY